MSDDLRQHFLLREDLVFLNHGSFGACPQPVLDRYRELQRELEGNPVAFLDPDREFSGRMRAARQSLAGFVGARRDDLVMVPNATYGLNVVARSFDLRPGDEVVITDHAYGAVERMWRYVCERTGARLVRAAVDLPIESDDQVVEDIWSRVTDRTRVLCVDHVTSPTALVMPVRALVRRSRRAGIYSVIDGAHGPGQLALDLDALEPDIYVGNGHKWLMAPRGAALLWARPEVQPLLEPLVVSWGWRSDSPGPSRFVDEQEWTGTRDPAAMLAVPAAIDFRREHDWPRVIRRCHGYLREVRAEMARLTGLGPICPDDTGWFVQMAAVPLPPCDPAMVKRALEAHRIEVPVFAWRDRPHVRVSVQGYNTRADIERLVEVMTGLLRDEGLFGHQRRARS